MDVTVNETRDDDPVRAIDHRRTLANQVAAHLGNLPILHQEIAQQVPDPLVPLVDPYTGEPVARNEAVARHASAHGVELQLELTSCQVETTTDVADSSEQLRAELTRLRHVAAESAEADGARLLAVGLPPTVPHEFPITDNPRYRDIAERFGMIAHEQGICGAHVHVAVPDRDAAIRVSNRMRPWLPLLLAARASSCTAWPFADRPTSSTFWIPGTVWSSACRDVTALMSAAASSEPVAPSQAPSARILVVTPGCRTEDQKVQSESGGEQVVRIRRCY